MRPAASEFVAELVELFPKDKRSRFLRPFDGALTDAEMEKRLTQLGPVFKDIDDTYTFGAQVQKLQDELMVINNPKNFFAKGGQEVSEKILKLRSEITGLNNQIVERMHALYVKEGLPSLISQHKDGSRMPRRSKNSPSV